MIIDFHTHIFPPDIRNRREKYFSDEPEFRLLYASPRSRMVGKEELLRAMDASRVEMAVVFGFPWRRSDTYRHHNDYIMEAVQRYPRRLIGFGCFDPAGENAVAEARRCVQGGLSGIGELAFYQTGISEKALEDLVPVMELCRRRRLPVLIHTNEPVGHAYPGKTPNTLAEIYRLIRRFPDNRLVLAHWGGGIFFFNLLKKQVKEALKNVYVDTAASPYLYDPDIYKVAVQCLGVEKILFGTDYPLLPPERYFQEMEQAGLSDPEKNSLCGANAARLLNME